MSKSIPEMKQNRKIPLVRPIAARGWVEGLCCCCCCCFPRRRIWTTLRKRIFIGIAILVFFGSLFQVLYPEEFAQAFERTIAQIPIVSQSDSSTAINPNRIALNQTLLNEDAFSIPIESPAIYPAQEGSMGFNTDIVKILSIHAFGSLQVVVDVRLAPKNVSAPDNTVAVSYLIHSATTSPDYPIHLSSNILRSTANITLLHQNTSNPKSPLPISNRITVGMSVILPEQLGRRSFHLDVKGDNIVLNVDLPFEFMGISTLSAEVERGGMKISGLNVVNATLKAGIAPVYGTIHAEQNVTLRVDDGIVAVNMSFLEQKQSPGSMLSDWLPSSLPSKRVKSNRNSVRQGSLVSVGTGSLTLTCSSYDALVVQSTSAKIDLNAYPKQWMPTSMRPHKQQGIPGIRYASAPTLTQVDLRRGMLNMNVHGFTGQFDAEATLGRVTVQGRNVHFDPSKTNPHHANGRVGDPLLARPSSFSEKIDSSRNLRIQSTSSHHDSIVSSGNHDGTNQDLNAKDSVNENQLNAIVSVGTISLQFLSN